MVGSIFFIDAENEFRRESAELLREYRLKVVEAQGLGELTGRVVAGDRFDLVIVDRTILDEEAIDCIAELEDRNENMGIVILSRRGHDPVLVQEIPKKIGITLVAQKPIRPEDLAQKIRTLIRMETQSPGSLSARTLPFEDPALGHEEQLALLRANYEGKIPMLMGKLGQALVGAQEDAHSTDWLDEAEHLSHALSGTAGSLGFHEVCTVAGAVEGVIGELKRIRQLTTVPPAAYAVPSEGPGDIIGSFVDETELDMVDEFSRSVVATVLVVDDDLEFLASAVSMGRDNLIRVYPASNGEEALDIASNQRIDAAIIDVGLTPDDNPFAIAKGIRSIDQNADLPISFMSTDKEIPTRIAAVHAGASLFLDKPLLSDEFAAAVRRLVPREFSDQPRIFVVDDDVDFLQHIKLLLEAQRMRVETLSDPTRILDVIGDVRPDIVLLDVVMPEINGFDVCRVLRSTDFYRDLPILFLTIHASDEVLLRCFESGGDDYIEKPVLKEEILARINVRMDRVRLYREKADRDGLTGLATRRAFIEQLKIRLAEGERRDKPVSLCLLDLDHFKRVNDKFGHLAGDRVLAGFGRLLSSRFRTMDVRGRWGGEEFVLAFYGEDAVTAKMIVRRVQEELSSMVFRGDHGEKFSVTFSAGVATYPNSGTSFEDLFRAVDEKLYAAKNAGRDHIAI